MHPIRILGMAGLVGLVALFPMIGTDYYVSLAIKIMIYAIFALSLQLLVGGTGLVSLGHGAFFGIAAYAAALLAPDSGPANLLSLLPAAMLAALIYALITGALALRTRGIYFIMVTLAFAQMAYFVFHDTDIGGGSDGIYLYFRPELRVGEAVLLNIDPSYSFYLFTLGCLLACWAFLSMLMRSRFGAALTGIRMNEPRMRSAGYSTFQYKLVAYTIAGALGGAAGFLYAIKDGYVNPELLAWEQSGLVLLMVILGGMGQLWGAIVGAVGLTLLQELFQSHAVFGDWASHWHLTFGLCIIALVALLPDGLIGLPQQIRRGKRRQAATQPAPMDPPATTRIES